LVKEKKKYVQCLVYSSVESTPGISTEQSHKGWWWVFFFFFSFLDLISKDYFLDFKVYRWFSENKLTTHILTLKIVYDFYFLLLI